MKKHLAALVVAVMMATGLVVASGGAASAHCAPSQYAGCFRTVTKVTATKRVPKGTRATVCVTVSPGRRQRYADGHRAARDPEAPQPARWSAATWSTPAARPAS